MPATVLMPLKYFGVSMPGHDGLDLVVDALERPLGLGHRLLDALLRGAVPREPRRREILGHRPERQRDARRDAADDDVDLLLEDELAVALDGVLRVRLLLDDELDLAAEDAARLVHAVGPPLGAAQPGGAHRRGDAGADGEHADLDRRGRGTPFLACAARPQGDATARGHRGAGAPSGIGACS